MAGNVISSHCIQTGFSYADRKLRHTAVYRVKTDSRQMAGMEVSVDARSASPDPVPAPFATFALFGSSDPNAQCQVINAECPDPKQKAEEWNVSVEWFPKEGDPDDDHTNEDDPLTRPLRYNSATMEVSKIVDHGWNVDTLPNGGNIDDSNPVRVADTYGPITDAAGVAPGTPYVRPKKIQILKITKNFATLAQIMALQRDYIDKLNDATFYGAPEGKAQVIDIIASSEMVAGGVSYREAEFHIAADADGFDFPMVNRGFEAWKEVTTSSGTELRLCQIKRRDERGNKVLVTAAQNLELDGTQTPEGKIGNSINWRLDEKADFSGMGIGTSF